MSRVAIIAGARTPFVKAGGALAKRSFLELGVHAVKSAIERSGVSPDSVDELIFSTVLLDSRIPNAARELVIRSGLPLTTPAHFISNNCISGLVAANMIAEGIRSGRLRTGVAGGAESMSRPALAWHPSAEAFFLALSRTKSFAERASFLLKYKLKYAFPLPPSPKEPSTGLTMGQHCELTAKEFSIPRGRQDEIAFRSHRNAAAAQTQGWLAQEIASIDGVDKDNLIRPNTTMEQLAKLPPVFDRSPAGTLTAGNSSALTDGASAVVLMAADEARKQGRDILGYIEDVVFSAVQPAEGLLMAPGTALPALMGRVGATVDNVDLFEIHEAFGAQVAANLHVWEHGWQRYPTMKPVGKIPDEKINVNGGSIAIGHPFAATGGRLILSACNELRRRKGKLAVLSVCAAGAMACAMAIRRE